MEPTRAWLLRVFLAMLNIIALYVVQISCKLVVSYITSDRLVRVANRGEDSECAKRRKRKKGFGWWAPRVTDRTLVGILFTLTVLVLREHAIVFTVPLNHTHRV